MCYFPLFFRRFFFFFKYAIHCNLFLSLIQFMMCDQFPMCCIYHYNCVRFTKYGKWTRQNNERKKWESSSSSSTKSPTKQQQLRRKMNFVKERECSNEFEWVAAIIAIVYSKWWSISFIEFVLNSTFNKKVCSFFFASLWKLTVLQSEKTKTRRRRRQQHTIVTVWKIIYQYNNTHNHTHKFILYIRIENNEQSEIKLSGKQQQQKSLCSIFSVTESALNPFIIYIVEIYIHIIWAKWSTASI